MAILDYGYGPENGDILRSILGKGSHQKFAPFLFDSKSLSFGTIFGRSHKALV